MGRRKNKNEYEEREDHCRIYMFNSIGACTGFTKVDKKNIAKLMKYSWRIDSVGYACTTIGGNPKRMHKMLIDVEEGFVTDHINRDKLDNREENLRAISRQENNFNRMGIGVRRTPARKWNARIRWNGREKHIGNFETFKEARTAYNNEKTRLLGLIKS